jgi:rhodanese-related sulfurtransferase
MDIPRITPEELKAKVDRGALHVPLAEIETGAASLPRDREIVAYCR